MTPFLWFLVGLWVGCSAGFLLFASLQVSRDGERVADASAIRGLERKGKSARPPKAKDPNARRRPARSDYLRPGWVEEHPHIADALGV